ncbi:MAG: hypothetical protein DYH02_09145 [Candidatus Omnitrophica bacterium COP1]|nr:hypothetical protein [Candidatus Omnitrophica bacterium COP1]
MSGFYPGLFHPGNRGSAPLRSLPCSHGGMILHGPEMICQATPVRAGILCDRAGIHKYPDGSMDETARVEIRA